MSRSASLSGAPALWTGRVLSGLAILFFLMDAAIKIPPIQPVIDTMGQLGWPTDAGTARILAALMLGATALYAWQPTSVLGAVLLTAYLGGAVATHARIGSPLLSHTLFGVYVGIIAWAGLWLREPRLRALIPVAR
jgi:predicted metal-binding membrane protein